MRWSLYVKGIVALKDESFFKILKLVIFCIKSLLLSLYLAQKIVPGIGPDFSIPPPPPPPPTHLNPYRLNMELDLQSLFGLLCTAVLIG